jgi:hypothetical protein
MKNCFIQNISGATFRYYVYINSLRIIITLKHWISKLHHFSKNHYNWTVTQTRHPPIEPTIDLYATVISCSTTITFIVFLKMSKAYIQLFELSVKTMLKAWVERENHIPWGQMKIQWNNFMPVLKDRHVDLSLSVSSAVTLSCFHIVMLFVRMWGNWLLVTLWKGFLKQFIWIIVSAEIRKNYRMHR